MNSQEKRPEWHHPKMTREQRAKQFLPFSAVRGYEEALRKKEAEYEREMAGEVVRIPEHSGEEVQHGDTIL